MTRHRQNEWDSLALPGPAPIRIKRLGGGSWRAFYATQDELGTALSKMVRQEIPVRVVTMVTDDNGRDEWAVDFVAGQAESPNRTVVYPLVIEDIVKRVEAGLEAYGDFLTTENGRDALQDAYEEALDLAIYLKQAMLEREARDGQS